MLQIKVALLEIKRAADTSVLEIKVALLGFGGRRKGSCWTLRWRFWDLAGGGQERVGNEGGVFGI